MQAFRETTDWGNSATPNHTYLLDGTSLVAYIKQGDIQPYYFRSPIKGFDRRGRKFVELSDNPFEPGLEAVDASVIRIEGSRGQIYTVDTQQASCTCPGFTFRGSCKHVKEHLGVEL